MLYYIFHTHHSFSHNKVCVCAIGKEENKYAREFVEHYKKYGIDKIFIYDNNDSNGENFYGILNDYIKSGFVKIINVRGKLKMQYPSHNHCYERNKNSYDWFIFYDMDEFIHLTNFTNIKDFLSNKTFDKCNVIYLNQFVRTDNDQIYYYNKSLFERFPNSTLNYDKKIGITKIILRGHLPKIKIVNPHILKNKYECNSIGKLNNLKIKDLYNNDFYYDHFLTKSSEEYLNKLLRGNAIFGERNGFNLNMLQYYFVINKITKEKLDFFENKTGVNLSIFRNFT